MEINLKKKKVEGSRRPELNSIVGKVRVSRCFRQTKGSNPDIDFGAAKNFTANTCSVARGHLRFCHMLAQLPFHREIQILHM